MKKITASSIKSGALISKKPIASSVEFLFKGEPASFEFYIKPYGYDVAIARMRAFGESKAALAGILASVLCDKKGKLLFTEKHIVEEFDDVLPQLIWEKVFEVNNMGKLTSLMTKTNSSVKSPSQQDDQSQTLETSNIEKSESGKNIEVEEEA
ncbi:phage tail assembly chaperone family protein, TAC [Acinetobacter guillouiae]